MSEPLLETGSLPGLDSNAGDDGGTEEAPYGYKADGSPRKRPGRKPGGTSTVNLNKLEPELADKLVEYIGLPMTVISPLAAGVIDARSEKTAKSLIRLAETSPRFRRALEAFIKGSAVSDVGLTAIAVIVAIRVDRTNQTPDEMGLVARYFDIDEIYYQVYSERETTSNGSSPVPRMGLMGEFDQ